jgi:putative chitinase
MINRAAFFTAVRAAPFGGRLEQSQVDGMTAILDQQDKLGWSDPRWRAYALATAHHETGGLMVPAVENLRYSAKRIADVWPRLAGRAKALEGNPEALAEAAYGGKLGNGPEGSGDGWLYRGRGVVQLTGRGNYRTTGQRLGMGDALEREPDIAMELDVSAAALCRGMAGGWFRPGNMLASFFTADVARPVEARAIINADVAANGRKIADLYTGFLAALTAGRDDGPQPPADAIAALTARVEALERKMAAMAAAMGG